jgi:hypothetical protein
MYYVFSLANIYRLIYSWHVVVKGFTLNDPPLWIFLMQQVYVYMI